MSKSASRAIHRRWIPVADSPSRRSRSQSSCHGQFSLCSYNVLSQSLVDRRNNLPYTNVFATRWKHRRLTLIDEIKGLDSDVLSMQEVDHYDDFWKPEMHNLGYETLWEPKPNKAYGLMTAWKRQRFELLESSVVQYNRMASGLQGLSFYELNKSNVALLCALRIKQQEAPRHSAGRNISNDARETVLILSNTHLYYRQQYNYTKLLQLFMLLREIVSMRKDIIDKHPHVRVLTITAGDFNFSPVHILYEFMTSPSRMDCSREMSIFEMPRDVLLNTNISYDGKQIVDASHDGQCDRSMTDSDASVLQQKLFVSAGEERHDQVLDLLKASEHLPVFSSCLSNYCEEDQNARKFSLYYPTSSEIPFTTFTKEFKGVTDYIMLSQDDNNGSNANIDAILSIPDEELLTMQTALPNEVLGSDHICIGVKITM